jgi:hypothetical protein
MVTKQKKYKQFSYGSVHLSSLPQGTKTARFLKARKTKEGKSAKEGLPEGICYRAPSTKLTVLGIKSSHSTELFILVEVGYRENDR